MHVYYFGVRDSPSKQHTHELQDCYGNRLHCRSSLVLTTLLTDLRLGTENAVNAHTQMQHGRVLKLKQIQA